MFKIPTLRIPGCHYTWISVCILLNVCTWRIVRNTGSPLSGGVGILTGPQRYITGSANHLLSITTSVVKKDIWKWRDSELSPEMQVPFQIQRVQYKGQILPGENVTSRVTETFNNMFSTDSMLGTLTKQSSCQPLNRHCTLLTWCKLLSQMFINSKYCHREKV